MRCGDAWYSVKDPLRSPFKKMLSDAWKTIASPIATWTDLWTLFRYRQNLMRLSPEDVLARPGIKTIDRLRELGFSQRIIDRFFRPFLGGIFLDENLQIDSTRMEFVFREMGLGTAALPAEGIQAIPESMCHGWKKGILQLNSTVGELVDGGVKLSNGKTVLGHKTIIATEASGAKRLLAERLPIGEKLSWNSTTCIYFSIAKHAAPTRDPILFLNGDPRQTSIDEFSINHVAFPSLVNRPTPPKATSLRALTSMGWSIWTLSKCCIGFERSCSGGLVSPFPPGNTCGPTRSRMRLSVRAKLCYPRILADCFRSTRGPSLAVTTPAPRALKVLSKADCWQPMPC